MAQTLFQAGHPRAPHLERAATLIEELQAALRDALAEAHRIKRRQSRSLYEIRQLKRKLSEQNRPVIERPPIVIRNQELSTEPGPDSTAEAYLRLLERALALSCPYCARHMPLTEGDDMRLAHVSESGDVFRCKDKALYGCVNEARRAQGLPPFVPTVNKDPRDDHA